MKKACLVAAILASSAGLALAEDWPMWGKTPQRNMTTAQKAPLNWSLEEKKGIKWEQQLGSQSYGNPTILNGIIALGTNNEAKRDPKFTADGGVLKLFRESDGKFLWQRYDAKLKAGRVNDWPFQGVCSTPFMQGDYLWYANNRCEIICLDLKPVRDSLTSDTPAEPKVVWKVDMMAELGVFPHNMTSCSITAHGDLIFVITGNGVDDAHKNLPAPKAPSIVAFNKTTGKVVWTDNSPGERVLHGQWASPAIATANGKTLVIAPLGDAWVYAYEAETGKIVWRFDANMKDTVYPTTRNELIATPVVVGNYMYIAVGQDPEHGEGPGHLWCVDITKTGDVSLELDNPDAKPPRPGEELVVPKAAVVKKGVPNPNSAVVWHWRGTDFNKDGRITSRERMNRTISTVTVHDGLVYAPDFSGFMHVMDAKSGEHYWTYDMEAAMWGSPMIADNKVYLCDEDGDVAIFEAGKEMKLLATHNMGSASYCSPVLANGVLYIMTREKLFAVQEK